MRTVRFFDKNEVNRGLIPTMSNESLYQLILYNLYCNTKVYDIQDISAPISPLTLNNYTSDEFTLDKCKLPRA